MSSGSKNDQNGIFFLSGSSEDEWIFIIKETVGIIFKNLDDVEMCATVDGGW